MKKQNIVKYIIALTGLESHYHF